jgi:hypothetical protein
VSRCFDKPLLTWNECVVGDFDDPTGVVVALPHSADRLDVGLAIRGTHWGAECMPDPGPGDVTIRAAWARLFTLREQWEWQHEVALPLLADEPPAGEPPEDWWPDEGTPAWMEGEVANGEQVWIAEWVT